MTKLLTRARFLPLAVTAFACLIGTAQTGMAQTEKATFVLKSVWLDPDITHPGESPQKMTGRIEWTYKLGDFDNGSGEFIELNLPWHNGGGPPLAWTIDVGQIEVTMPGNWHNWGADVSLKLAQPLALDQPAPIDLVLSKFDIEAHGVVRKGHVISGSVVPESPFAPFCFGDGSGTACPCGNPGDAGAGCENSSGVGGTLVAHGSASVGADDLTFAGVNLLHKQPALLIRGAAQANGGAGIVLGDGLLCVGGKIVRLEVAVPDAGGNVNWGPGLAGGLTPGVTQYFQCWYRDPSGSPCGAGYNLTNAVAVTFVP